MAQMRSARAILVAGIAVIGLGILPLGAQAALETTAQEASQAPTQTATPTPPLTKKPTATTTPAKNTKTNAAPAKTVTPAATKPVETKQAAVAGDAGLESVLDQLDKASADFKSTEADFVWEQYQKVVDEMDTQKGRITFLRVNKETTNMAASVIEPDKKELVFADGKLKFYQPRIDQITEYDAGKNKGEVEAFLVLGFGGRGHDLAKSFNVKLAGSETIDGVRTAKLELDPKAPKVKNNFAQIILWIDPARGVSLQQKFIEPSGDYRLAHYTNFKMNGKVGDEAFKIKTTAKTKVVKQQ